MRKQYPLLLPCRSSADRQRFYILLTQTYTVSGLRLLEYIQLWTSVTSYTPCRC